MTYGGDRDQQYFQNLRAKIAAFALTYDSARPTIVLFPGGMASRLMRGADRTNPAAGYYTSWLSANIVTGEAENLKIEANGDDLDQHYVIADNYINFSAPPLFDFRPYVNFSQWCADKNIQLFVFGYDWRRSAQDAANYFLTQVMPEFDNQIGGGLQNFTLLGHSLGGMVVKLIANNHTDTYVQKMHRAITVGAPFYGYGGQIHRYLMGISWLDWTFADPARQDRRMARLIATMPGGYEYLYLDHDSYVTYATDFAADPEYPITAYPCMEELGSAPPPADPYHPQQQGNWVRYPLFTAADEQKLADALVVSKAVSERLDASVAARFYCIRGVQKKYGVRLQETVVSSTWRLVDKTVFDPDAWWTDDPITDTNGYGDDTQPAWTARLLQLHEEPYRSEPLAHVITVTGDISHIYLLDSVPVQAAVQSVMQSVIVQDVMQQQSTIRPRRKWSPPPMATLRQLNTFLRNLPKDRKKKPKTPEERRLDLNRYLGKLRLEEFNLLMARIFHDMLKSPSQVLLPKRRRPKKKPDKKPDKKPAPKRRRR